MRRLFGTVLAGALLSLATLTPAAMASGGVNSGGVNSGGGGGGGGTPVTTVPVSTSCAQITSFSNSTGYYSVWAAIWTKFSISDACASPASWTMTYTNGNTGAVDFVRGSSTAYMPSGTIDEDWAAFSTPYTVTLNVTDASGATLASQSALVTTKVGKTAGA
jgi:hypothetical protein